MYTLQQFFDKCIQMGIERGPRSKQEIERRLKDLKKQFDKMESKDKEYFDVHSLTNPYLDSGILAGDPKTPLKRILVGIDIGVGEILLASELTRRGKKVDAVIAHHPEGRALINLTQVMDLQHETYMEDGMPINVVQKLMGKRVLEIDRGLHPHNHYQVPDAARLLDIPFANLHTFADNHAYWFMKNYMNKKKPRFLSDIMDALLQVPEFKDAKKKGNPPMIYVGDPKAEVGKISYSGFTGGTDGPKELFEKMAHAGVGTLLAMHIPKDSREMAEKYHINVVITGHMASDSLGVNFLMDEAERHGVEILECGSFKRVSRVKGKLPF